MCFSLSISPLVKLRTEALVSPISQKEIPAVGQCAFLEIVEALDNEVKERRDACPYHDVFRPVLSPPAII